jgi:hypothetical protein
MLLAHSTHVFCLSNIVVCPIIVRTSPEMRAEAGKEEAEAGPGPPGGDKSGSWNPAEVEET